MTALAQTSAPRFAWAGFSLHIPAGWNPVALEKDFVRFEDGGGPRLECRWQPTEGAYRLERHLSKAASQMKRAAAFRTDGVELPALFLDALRRLEEHGFTAKPFAWTDAAGEAANPGALLHHAESGIAVIIRAFPRAEADEDTELADALATARCHPRNADRLWSVFGVRVWLPGTLYLKTFSFRPGHFRMEFLNSRRVHLVLERLGPAQFALKGRSLEEWAAGFFKSINLRSARHSQGPDGWSVLEKPWPRGFFGAISRRLPLMLRTRRYRLGLCLADQETKILTVRMEGPAPLPDGAFEKICESYEVV